MSHCADLTPCSYFGQELADKLTAVGWLDIEHPYTQDSVSQHFLKQLFKLLVKPWNLVYLMGYAECELCELDIDELTYDDQTVKVGNLNLFIPGDGFLYVAPSLIAHYILAHGYAPPQEFCDAVLRCPPMGSEAYFHSVVQNGPQQYADAIKKQFLKSE